MVTSRSRGCLAERDPADPAPTKAHLDPARCTTGKDTGIDGFSVGDTTSDSNPHWLVVQHDGDSQRMIALSIIDAETDDTKLDTIDNDIPRRTPNLVPQSLKYLFSLSGNL